MPQEPSSGPPAVWEQRQRAALGPERSKSPTIAARNYYKKVFSMTRKSIRIVEEPGKCLRRIGEFGGGGEGAEHIFFGAEINDNN